MDCVNKTELVNAVAALKKVDPEEVLKVLDGIIDVIGMALSCDEDVLVSNFGRFEVRQRRAVTRRNPKTGEPVEVPAKRSLGFRPAPRLKARLNG